MESITERRIGVHLGATEDQISLKDSLVEIRNLEQAAVQIQSAFQFLSFGKRYINNQNCNINHLTPEEIHDLFAASKVICGHRDQKIHTTALRIQKKHHGWRGHKNYLTLHRHVINRSVQLHYLVGLHHPAQRQEALIQQRSSTFETTWETRGANQHQYPDFHLAGGEYWYDPRRHPF